MSAKPQPEVKPFTTAGTLAWKVILVLRKRIEKDGAS
jgi:hypothetical protein